MEDSYYGTRPPRGGRHARPSRSDAEKARKNGAALEADEKLEVSAPEEAADVLPVEADVQATDGATVGADVLDAADTGDAPDTADDAGSEGEVEVAVEAADEAESQEVAEATDGAEASDNAEAADKSGAHAGTAAEKPKKKRGPWGIVFIVALVVFIGSMVALALIAFSYCQGQQKYESVARDAGLEAVDTSDLATLEVDWDALRAVNSDVVAWVYVPNTPINYPVVQGSDNDYYLVVDFDGDAGWLANYGAIFLDYRNKPDFSDKANFIYGHHMNDGSMFAELANFGDQARFDECRTVYLLTPEANYRLRSFALLHVDGTEALVQNEFADDKEFQAYVQDKIDRSAVDPGSIPGVKDIGRVFALATCDDYGSGRFVLYCYVEDETASGLTGTLGIAQEDGETVGFDDGLSTEEGQAAEEEQPAEGEQAEEEQPAEEDQSAEEEQGNDQGESNGNEQSGER